MKKNRSFGMRMMMPPYAMNQARLRQWIDIVPFLLFGYFFWTIMHSPMRINHDCAYVLQCSKILVDGGLPYVDFIDINPPLIFYMNMAPVVVAQTAGITLPQAFSLFVTLQLAASALLLFYLFRLEELNLKAPARFALLLAWILCSLFVYATGDYGQRDHLVMLMVFPFILVRVIRYYGDRVSLLPSLVIGVMTGLGLSLKPNFYFIVLVPEFVALVRTRRIRTLFTPEMYAAIAFSLAYALHFLLLPALVQTELFGRWMPFFMQYYGTINMNLFHHVFMQPLVIAGLIVLAFVVGIGLVIIRQRGMSSLRMEILSAAAIGSFLSYWIQQKGYSYHSVPLKLVFVMLALFVSFWLYEEIMHRTEEIPLRRFVAVSPTLVVLAGLIALTARAFASNSSYVSYESFAPYRQAISAYSKKDDRVLFLNTILFPAYPTLVQMDRMPGSRYLTIFPIAGFYYGMHADSAFPYRSRGLMNQEELRFLCELEADIDRFKPSLIFIHAGETSSAMPEGFDIHEYFIRSHFTTDAMHDYERSGSVGDFFLYRRKKQI